MNVARQERTLPIFWAVLVIPLLLPDLHQVVVAWVLFGVVVLSFISSTAPPILVSISSALAAGLLFVERVTGLPSAGDVASLWISNHLALPLAIVPSVLASRVIVVYAIYVLVTKRMRPVRTAAVVNIALPLCAYGAFSALV